MELTALQRKITKGYLSRIGFALLSMLIASFAMGYLISAILDALPASLPYAGWDPWFFLLISNYTVPLIICVLIMHTVPGTDIPRQRVRAGKMFTIFLICYGILFLGNLIGLGVSSLLGMETTLSLVGDTAVQLILDSPTTVSSILAVCFIGPIVEEFVFRKLLVDRLARYGEWVAVFTSALLFGLFHGNFQQFFYAFGIGLAFGHLYYKTGRIWYTMLLHCIVNTIPNLILPLLRENAFVPLLIASLLILCIAGAGVTLLIIWLARFFRRRKALGVGLRPRVAMLPQKGWASIVFINPGMLALLAAFAVYFCSGIFFAA